MAQQLQKQGHEVALLAILDQPAPVFGTHPMEMGPDLDDARWVQLYAEIIEKTCEKTLEVSYEALQPLDLDEQLHYLMERLSRVGLLPPDVGITQIRGLLWVLKANCQAAVDYVPQDAYRTRITLFRASEGNPAAVPNERMPRKFAEILQEPTLGWERFSAGPVNLHFVPGNHESLVTEPHVQVLAEQLRVCLEQAQAGDFKT